MPVYRCGWCRRWRFKNGSRRWSSWGWLCGEWPCKSADGKG
jgi:hypothetical protein